MASSEAVASNTEYKHEKKAMHLRVPFTSTSAFLRGWCGHTSYMSVQLHQWSPTSCYPTTTEIAARTTTTIGREPPRQKTGSTHTQHSSSKSHFIQEVACRAPTDHKTSNAPTPPHHVNRAEPCSLRNYQIPPYSRCLLPTASAVPLCRVR